VKLTPFVVALIPLALTSSCRLKDDASAQEAMTVGEAQQAVEEAAVSGEAANLMSGSIEIATDFTIGGAVEAAANEIKSFLASQMPCAEVTLTGATLSIEYGVKAGNCTYKGLTYSGTHTVTVSSNDENDVLVEHTWDELSNGRVSVTGSADVTWSLQNESRHVVHDVEWTRLWDGKTGLDTGDSTQTLLEGGLTEGIQVDGSRAWEGTAGRWDLTIEGVQMRWVDPVPQAGTYRLATPKNKSATLGFERVDEDTIKVTLSSGGKSFDFNVSKLGGVSQ
jgi:hypothetical protein